MKKLLLFLLLGLGLVVAALPYVNGIIMEKVVCQTLERANQMQGDSGSDIRFELVSYDRGYARTRAEWKIDLGAFSQVYGTREIYFTERADHGFLSITSRTGLEKNPWFSDWARAVQPAEERGTPSSGPLAIETRYAAFGPIITRVTLDALTLENKGSSLHVRPFEADLTTSRSLDRVSVKGQWQGLSQDGGASLGPVVFESGQERISDLVWKGRTTVLMESLESKTGEERMSISDLGVDVSMDTDRDQTRMTLGSRITTGRIMVNGTPLDGWTIDSRIKNVDITAYEAVLRIYTRMVNQVLSSGASPEARGRILEKALAGTRMKLAGSLEKLLKKDLEIQVSRLDISLPKGAVHGDFSLVLKKEMTLAGFFPLLVQPSMVLDIFSLDCKAAVSKGLVVGRAELTEPLFPGMQTGLFMVKGDNLILEARTRDDGLYLNGHKVDLDDYASGQ